MRHNEIRFKKKKERIICDRGVERRSLEYCIYFGALFGMLSMKYQIAQSKNFGCYPS